MGKGIRAMRGRIQIRYTVHGRRFEESLDLPQTEEGFAEAEAIRVARKHAKKHGIQPVVDGVGVEKLHKAVNDAFKAARKRGGDAYALTFDEEQKIVHESRGACQVTFTPFSLHRQSEWRRAPFAPSVDRIDSSLGYVAGNVRLVCVAANLAMNEWGESVLSKIAHGYVNSHESGCEVVQIRKVPTSD